MKRVGVIVAFTLVCGACGPSAAPSDDDDGGGTSTDARSTDSSFSGCATATYDASPVPAALLVVLDKSSSMSANSKWATAAQAIVQALDHEAFDAVSVGLLAAPSGSIAGPSCLFGLPVSCQAPPFPQIDLTLAGTNKSTAATGVRKQIKDWLTANVPDSGLGDATPFYAALENAIVSLKGWPMSGKRVILAITDGTLSCNEFSTNPARPGYQDCNNCARDWENPMNIISLLGNANLDGQKPIESFIVGVPGANTTASTGCSAPPYNMRAALSAIAAAGSPANIPASCNGRTYSQGAAEPSMPCHFDMSGGSFSTTALADAIAKVRGATLGCTLELPTPAGGGTVDRTRVNVELTVGGVTSALAKRADASNMCTQTGCWDYTVDGKVQLIGKACTDATAGGTVQAKIVTGCVTQIL